MDQNITEIRSIIKNILKKNKIDLKENKFSVKFVSFQDLARDGKYFVEFRDLSKVSKLVIYDLCNICEKEYKREDMYFKDEGIFICDECYKKDEVI